MPSRGGGGRGQGGREEGPGEVEIRSRGARGGTGGQARLSASWEVAGVQRRAHKSCTGALASSEPPVANNPESWGTELGPSTA